MKHKKKTKKRKKKMKLAGMKKVSRNVELALTRNDVTNRYGPKVVPNKKRVVKKFNFRKDAD